MKELNVEYNRFEKGIDLRKSSAVSDANRMQMVRNAYVTSGWAIKKRAGTKLAFSNLAGTSGIRSGLALISNQRGLITVNNSSINTVATPDPGLYPGGIPGWFPEMGLVDISDPSNAGKTVAMLHQAITFNQVDYMVVEFTDGTVQHFFAGSVVTQPTSSVTVVNLSGRMYSGDGDVVRFSKVSNPTDWVGTDDAGFLAVGIQSSGAYEVVAVAEYDKLLAVFMVDSVQLWITDPDPSLHQLNKIINGVGTSFYKSIQSFCNDIIFIKNIGFRSISRQQYTDNRQDNDVGSPIDDLVIEQLKSINYDPSKVFSSYFQELGQYWCFIGNTAFIYTFSPSAKISAWSIYEFGFNVTDVHPHYGYMFLRDDANNVFLFDDRENSDNGTNYRAEVLFSFQSQKAPAINKRFNSLDLVQQGSSMVSHLYDPRDLTQETDPIQIVGNTRPSGRYPMGLLTTEIATRLVNETNEEWQFDSLMYFYNKIGVRV